MRFLSFVVACLITWGCSTTAQVPVATTYTTKKTTTAKAKSRLEEGNDLFAAGQLERAAREYDKAMKEDPKLIEAQIQWAAVQQEMGQLENAETGFMRALTTAPAFDTKVYYVLANLQMDLEKYADAAKNYDLFLKSASKNEDLRRKATARLKNAQFADEAVKHPVPFTPQSLGDKVNTPYPDYLPSLTADGNTLVYSTRLNGQEDYYTSHKENGAWIAAEPLAALNTPGNEGAQCIAADGKTLYMTICDAKDSYGGCDLYMSTLQNGTWSAPKNMGNLINSPSWESQPSLSADGKQLYFASKRPGGLGGSDIWVSTKDKVGKWAAPVNIGSTLNTPEDEACPFIHADNQSLYFSSKGHPGMGDQDLYIARRTPDGAWNAPTNLGYPINTTKHEGALIVSIDGTTAYYASDRNANPKDKLQTDLYSFELPAAVRPIPSTYVKIQVTDAATRQRLSTPLQVTQLQKGTVYLSTQTDSEGEALVCLPTGTDYGLAISKTGYLFHSENFELTATHTALQPFDLKVKLQPVGQPAAHQPIVLKNVFFETGSATLQAASTLELMQLVQLLQDSPSLRIRINGHTDNVGNDADNQSLSTRRAKAVYDFLLAKGIAAARLEYIGFGESRPMATNDTPEGRRTNRRTEFEVLPQ